MNPLNRIAIAALATAFATACEAPPPSTSPPFRIQATGPGLDPTSAGRPVDLYANDARVARVRVRPDAVRVYDGDAARLGRLRVTDEGWSVQRRDGTSACVIVVEGSGERLTCSGRAWRFTGNADTVRIEVVDGDDTMTLVDAEGSGARAEQRDLTWTVSSSTEGWTVRNDGGGHWEVRGEHWPAAATVPWAGGLPDEGGLEGSGDVPLARAAAGWLVARRITPSR